MIRTEIRCDCCNTNVATTCNANGWRIVVDNQAKTPTPVNGALTLAHAVPPIEGGPMHFCSPRCLVTWAVKEWPQFATEVVEA